MWTLAWDNAIVYFITPQTSGTMKLCLHGSAEVNNGLPGPSKSRKKKICSKGIAYKASHNVKKSGGIFPQTARVWGHM